MERMGVKLFRVPVVYVMWPNVYGVDKFSFENSGIK